MDIRAVENRIELRITGIMEKLKPTEIMESLCDDIIADLKTLCAEAKLRGTDAVQDQFNYPCSERPYVTASGWSPKEPEWYKGWYIGIGLDYRTPSSFGFMTKPIVKALRDRFETMRLDYCEGIYKTREGNFLLEHGSAWFVKRMIEK